MNTESVIVRKVGVSSLGKLVGTVQAIVGLAVGIIAAIVGTVSVVSNSGASVLMNLFCAVGIVLVGLVVYPLVAFLIGWLYAPICSVCLCR